MMMRFALYALLAASIAIQTEGRSSRSRGSSSRSRFSAPNALFTPKQHSTNHNSSVIFKCLVGGSPRPVIHWKKNNRNEYMHSEDGDRIQIEANTGTLTISRAKPSDSGTYICLATNSLGSVEINFPLNVRDQPTNNAQDKTELTYKQKCLSSPNISTMRCSDLPSQRRYRSLWTYNSYLKRCLQRILKDCSTLYNKYESREACEGSCMNACQLRYDQGSCNNYVAKLYYNPASGDCEPFAYGGCGGNANNFRDISACRSQCAPHLLQAPPAPKNCPFCSRHLATAYCNSNFVISGKLIRTTPRYYGSSYRGVRIQITQVFKDESNLLGGKHINTSAPLHVEKEFELAVDKRCPCPNLRSIVRTGVHSDYTDDSIQCSYHEQPRRTSSRHCRELVISGQNINGILTITQGSLAAVATRRTVSRMTSNTNFPAICRMMKRIERIPT